MVNVRYGCRGCLRAYGFSGRVRRRSCPWFKLKSQKIELPVEKQTFGTGPEADAANAHCLTCHSRGMIDTQPPMPLAVWKAEINKMRSAFGCSAPEELVDSLSKFFEHLNNQPATRQEARAAHR